MTSQNRVPSLTRPGAFAEAALSYTDRLGHSNQRLPYTQEVRGYYLTINNFTPNPYKAGGRGAASGLVFSDPLLVLRLHLQRHQF